jgi:hypothetical protein
MSDHIRILDVKILVGDGNFECEHLENTSSDPKKGALDFKNLKLKKFLNNLSKLN